MPRTVEYMPQRSDYGSQLANAGPPCLYNKPNQHKKTPAKAGVSKSCIRLFRTNVRCLLALRASGHFKGDALIFLERLEAARLDCGEVREQIFATFVGGNEAKTLRIIEPLYDASCHYNFLFQLSWVSPLDRFNQVRNDRLILHHY